MADDALRKAVAEMKLGLIEARLGGCLYKKRVALTGRGKRGSARTIVATRFRDRWIFLYGFQKSERENIDEGELKVLQEIAGKWLAADDEQLAVALTAGKLVEVPNART